MSQVNKNKRKGNKIFFCMILCLLIAGCISIGSNTSNVIQSKGFPVQLASLRKVSDYPFYELYFKGDYGFDNYIKTRINIPFQEERIEIGSYACSCFSALGDTNQSIFGRNFDWYDHPVLILFTDPPLGYESVSMVDISYLGYDKQHSPLDNPDALLRAPFLPFDGMNEQGLAVGMMAVSHAEGGNDPKKITLDELELIRLILDYSKDVPEALELIKNYNVDFGSVPVHFLLADAVGNSSMVEYLDGKPIILTTEKSWQAATNFLISEENPQDSNSSCWRYNHLVKTLESVEGRMNEKEGIRLLKEVSQPGQTSTKWSIVYNLTDKKVSLVLGRDYGQVYEYFLSK